MSPAAATAMSARDDLLRVSVQSCLLYAPTPMQHTQGSKHQIEAGFFAEGAASKPLMQGLHGLQPGCHLWLACPRQSVQGSE